MQVTPDSQLTGTADVEHTDEVQQGSPPRQPWQGRRLGAQPGRRGAAGLDGVDHGFPPQGRRQYRPALHYTALEHRGDQAVSAERQRRFWPEAGAPVDDESPAAAQLSVTADGDMNRPRARWHQSPELQPGYERQGRAVPGVPQGGGPPHPRFGQPRRADVGAGKQARQLAAGDSAVQSRVCAGAEVCTQEYVVPLRQQPGCSGCTDATFAANREAVPGLAQSVEETRLDGRDPSRTPDSAVAL